MAKRIDNAGGLARVTLLSGTIKPQIGDLLGYASGWVFADANSNPIVPAEFMVMGDGDAASTTGDQIVNVCTSGILVDDTAPFTAGAAQYLSNTGTTGNTITATMPAAAATLAALQKVGIAIATDTMTFDLNRKSTMLRFTVAYTPTASLGAATAQSDTVTVTGLLTTDIIRGQTIAGPLTGTGWNSGLFNASYDVSAADTLRIRNVNPTNGTLSGAAVTLTLLAERLTV